MRFVLLLLLALQQPATPILDGLLKELASLRTHVVAPLTKTVTVKAGESIQAAIDAAPDGTEIRIAPGVYPVNLILRANKTGMVIRSDVPDPVLILPWVTPALVAVKLATLIPLDPLAPIISTALGAHDYTLRLLEIGPNLALPDRDLIAFGTFSQTDLATIPYNLDIDRCYIHGSEAKGGRRGVALNSRNSTITGSYLSTFWFQGQDSQAIAGAAGPGPYRIEHNYLEASGENVLFGGSDPLIPGLIPSDIIVRGNYLYKPLAWKTKPGSVKNCFELKNAQRVLIENNLIENVWTDGQAGNCVVFTVRDQDGGCPWCTVRDVTFQYNVIKNVTGYAINVLGLDNNHVSVQATTLTISNTLALGVGNGLLVQFGFIPTAIRHTTITGVHDKFLDLEGAPLPTGALTYTDNVTTGGVYGLVSSGLSPGLPSLTAMAPGATFTHNVIEGNIERVLSYPPGNYPIPAGQLAAKLDPSWKYLGPEASSDGTPLGADVVELRRRIPWAVW